MNKQVTTLTTTRQVMAVLGGTKAVANLTGRKYAAAHAWHRFPTFPSNTFLVIGRALEDRGYFAAPSLWGMNIPEEVE